MTTGRRYHCATITDATGKKFGKSEGKRLAQSWKDSPYEMYHFGESSWMLTFAFEDLTFLSHLTWQEIRKHHHRRNPLQEISKTFLSKNSNKGPVAPNYQVQADENQYRGTPGVIRVVNPKRQAREDVQNGAIYVNGDRIQDLWL